MLDVNGEIIFKEFCEVSFYDVLDTLSSYCLGLKRIQRVIIEFVLGPVHDFPFGNQKLTIPKKRMNPEKHRLGAFPVCRAGFQQLSPDWPGVMSQKLLYKIQTTTPAHSPPSRGRKILPFPVLPVPSRRSRGLCGGGGRGKGRANMRWRVRTSRECIPFGHLSGPAFSGWVSFSSWPLDAPAPLFSGEKLVLFVFRELLSHGHGVIGRLGHVLVVGAGQVNEALRCLLRTDARRANRHLPRMMGQPQPARLDEPHT